MKRNTFLVFSISAALSCISYGAGYISSFSGSPEDQLVDDFPNPGIDGWTQSEGNNSPDQPKAWISQVGTSGGLGVDIGGYYDVYDGSSFTIDRAFSPLALNGSSMSMTVGIVDPEAFFDRNDFSISLFGAGSSNLISIDLTANTQNFPAVTESDSSWNVSVNGAAAFAAIFADAAYDLSVSFFANGADLDYEVNITGGVGNVFTTNGTLVGEAGAAAESLQMGTTLGNGSDWGDNIMGFAGIEVIPEPSSILLMGIGALGLLRRRRVS